MFEQFGQFSAHEPLSNFFGATADIVELRVSEEAAAHILVDVAVATVQLDALVGRLDCGPRRLEENGS